MPDAGALLRADARDDDAHVLFPQETFRHFPYNPSLEGQYIIKNLVLISAGIVIGATMRGGRIIPRANLKAKGGQFLARRRKAS